MNVVDSSGWLEFFADGPNADFFAPAITDESRLLVPTICIYEVFKRLCAQRGKEQALAALGTLYRGQIVDLTDEIALQAALLSLEHRLPMADSLILATAHLHDATLWTQDEHFQNLPGVEYRPVHRDTQGRSQGTNRPASGETGTAGSPGLSQGR